MKKMIILLLLTFGMLQARNASPVPSIHVFGDSHSFFCFSADGHSTYFFDYETMSIPFFVHQLGPKTMHSIGRDGLNVLNLTEYALAENDVAVFTLGEIDVRCHIGKQRDQQKRSVDEILDELVAGYINTINLNRALFEQITCVIMEVMPPSDECRNAKFPFYGSLADRVNINVQLNKKLLAACQEMNILFLPTNDIYALDDGSLNFDLSDHCVHANIATNYRLRERLAKLLHEKR